LNPPPPIDILPFAFCIVFNCSGIGSELRLVLVIILEGNLSWADTATSLFRRYLKSGVFIEYRVQYVKTMKDRGISFHRIYK
jgi:hypothetical protein